MSRNHSSTAFIIRVALAGFLTSFVGLSQNPEIRIMPLGDSITRGTNDINYPNGSIPGGYRRELGTRLANAGLGYDFVGQKSDNAFPGMDPDHDGNDGIRTDQILSNLSAWLVADPGIVLLHAGSNDILQDFSVATAAANLSSIIDQITANAPSRRLYVATIIPIIESRNGFSAAYLNGNANSYNTQVRSLVQQFASQGRGVFLVEMNGGIVLTDPNPANNFFQPGDGIHPGQAGYNQMGAIWFNAIASGGALFPPPPPGAPAAPGSLAATVISGGRINLTWVDASTDETAFELFQKTGFSGTWQPLTTLGPDSDIFSLTGLAAAADPRFFAIRATNASGASAWSNIAATLPLDLAAGKPASASSSFAPAYVASEANDNDIQSIWAAASGDTLATWTVDLSAGFRIHHLKIVSRQDLDQPVVRRNFELRASNDPLFSNYEVLLTEGGTGFPHMATYSAAVGVATPFRYLQLAKTDGGDFTLAEVKIYGAPTPSVPPAPSDLTITGSGETTATLGWSLTSPLEIGFKLQRKTGAAGTFAEIAAPPANATVFTDTGLAPQTQYFYRILATNGVDDSAFSLEAAATTTGSYETWAASYPDFLALPPAQRAPAADPNNDGLENLLCFAMSLDPLAFPPPGALPRRVGQSFLYRRRKATGLDVTVLVSPDLQEDSWQIQDQSAATVESVPGDDSVELITVPLAHSLLRNFARLRVIRTTP